jgi:hypothetical protein
MTAMKRALILIPIALALAGCGGSGELSVERAEQATRTIVAKELEKGGYDASVLKEVMCVRTADSNFECVLTVEDAGVDQKIGGTLTCSGASDTDRCIYRGELRGG